MTRSLLPSGLLNVQHSWSPPLAELRRRPPGVQYEVREVLLGTLAQETPTDHCIPTTPFPQRAHLADMPSFGIVVRGELLDYGKGDRVRKADYLVGTKRSSR